jgi:hypothetical protein
MKKSYRLGHITIGIVSLFILNSCNDKKESKKEDIHEEVKTTSLQRTNFDLSQPVGKWSLSDSLAEISGIVFQKNGNLLAIEDMHPILYELKLGDSTATIVNKIEFRKTDEEKFDFEDLAIANDSVYALWSHGAIFKIVKKKNGYGSERSKTWLKKNNNTEGLCYDPVTGNLLVACKDESGLDGEKKSTRSVFQFDIKGDSLMTEPFMTINKKDFESVAGEKVDFYPAAIAVDPVTHDIFIISTKETKCIAQFSHDGRLKAFDYFDKEMLPQPEGICFDKDRNLYVSTEARHSKPPYIYKFALKK